MSVAPVIEIYAEQSPYDVDLAKLQIGWEKTAALLAEIGVGEIAVLELIEISLLGDPEMAQVHGEFLADPTPTDVITFEHGELLIGVEVALRQAREYEYDLFREVALYGIHGMLHLSGFDDHQELDFERMRERQEELLAVYFPA
ncbi:MAG: rRNA maturation RNase YbeY [Akkermansiaceae bacterium]